MCVCQSFSLSESESPWTVACQVLPSMGFPRQEYCNGLPFLSPGDLPNPGIKPWSPLLQADSLPSKPPGKPLERQIYHISNIYCVLCNSALCLSCHFFFFTAVLYGSVWVARCVCMREREKQGQTQLSQVFKRGNQASMILK